MGRGFALPIANFTPENSNLRHPVYKGGLVSTVTVILHGWSDSSASFIAVKTMLVEQGIGQVETIYFADYESREDNLTFNDVIDGLNEKFIEAGFVDAKGKPLVELNVIVHSTGGLVIRHWIAWYYARHNRMAECPVKRIVMLAPANFGSPLAHRGKSFLGMLVKGRWRVGDFLEVGRQLLNGLELGSPFQWWLAHQDLLRDDAIYSAAGIQVTVLVGIRDYTGIRGWVNKPGTDGTVVIAGTSIDTAKVTLDFCTSVKGQTINWAETDPPSEFGLGILQHYDHGSIVDAATRSDSDVGKVILRALTTAKQADFKALIDDLEKTTKATYATVKKAARYQQFILHAIDDFGESIGDFNVEFYALNANRTTAGVLDDKEMSGKERYWTEKFNKIMLAEVHTHTVDPSYRRLLVNVDELKEMVARARHDMKADIVVGMRIYVPPIDAGISYDHSCLQNIVIYDPLSKKKALTFFYENTTTLVELRVNRLSTYVKLATTV